MLVLYLSSTMAGEFQQLLTDDDRRAHLHKLLGHRLKAAGKLQLPTLAHYQHMGTDDGLRTAGYDMCRQIGFKPNGLKIKYGTVALVDGYAIDRQNKTVVIDPQLALHPYHAGATLAMGTLAYVVGHVGDGAPSKSFVEFATIEAGLGLWLVNALKPRVSIRQKLYHLIDSSWFHSEGIQLVSYSQRQYVERVASFAHENRIAADTYLPHVLRRVRYLFPAFILAQSQRHLPEAPATLIHRKSANQLWLKVLLVALILTSGVIFGTYIIATRPAPTNPEIEELQKSISELKRAYESCKNTASQQQSTYDPNDLFLTRQIDETKSRCESLRNQYNYTVDQYQHSYQPLH